MLAADEPSRSGVLSLCVSQRLELYVYSADGLDWTLRLFGLDPIIAQGILRCSKCDQCYFSLWWQQTRMSHRECMPPWSSINYIPWASQSSTRSPPFRVQRDGRCILRPLDRVDRQASPYPWGSGRTSAALRPRRCSNFASKRFNILDSCGLES